MQQRIDILLVEDNEDHVFLIRKALERFLETPLEIQVVSDGIKAVSFIRKEPPFEHTNMPQLILLDINLPNKNGLEVLREIRAHAASRTIPVIMLTSSDAKRDVDLSYRLGSNSYVVKPIRSDELDEKLRSIPDYWLKTNTLPPKVHRP